MGDPPQELAIVLGKGSGKEEPPWEFLKGGRLEGLTKSLGNSAKGGCHLRFFLFLPTGGICGGIGGIIKKSGGCPIRFGYAAF
jgi:hypothetical protein